MRIEKNYDFCKRLLEVHKKDRRDNTLLPANDEFCFASPTVILVPEHCGEVIMTAAKDFADYLFTSMNVAACVDRDRGQEISGAVRLAVNTDLGEASERRGHRVTVDSTVLVEGYDECGVAQGLYYLEDLMNLRRAPFLKKESKTRRVMFYPRTVMSGYGVGEYPDDYLALLAHHGFSGIMLWIKGINENQKGFQNFTDLAVRAARYGFDIYVMSYTAHEVYPEGEEAQEFYDRLYGDLFAACPFIKGLIIVGEAVKFPSRDKSLPEGTPPGWWPCSDWPLLLKMIQNAVNKIKPDVEVILCSYNWGKQPKELRQKLIRSLPEGVLLSCGWEMFESYDLYGTVTRCCDYSLRVVEPGYYFLTEAEVATECGIKLQTIANSGGKTWDFGAIPFDPAPYRWAERFEALRRAHDENNLTSLMDSIHFGVHPSFISEIAKWAFAEPRVDLNELIPRILAMHFGDAEIDKIDAAMKKWSEALANMVPADEDQYGALRVGPSHPLYAGRERCQGISPPQDKFAMSKLRRGMYENVYAFRERGVPRDELMPKEIRAFEYVKQLLWEGICLLEGVEDKNEELLRLINMGHFMHRTIITALHTKRFYLLDQARMACEDDAERNGIIQSMIDVLADERENAEATIPLVEYDSALGFEPSIEYVTDRPRLEWKMKQVEDEAEMLRGWMRL
ncbi:MAG: hypothetical protein E7644_00665 [Ruminococcaceae bacterium]|nr:hypothetical protein [Oscillospiraceae bacterium]